MILEASERDIDTCEHGQERPDRLEQVAPRTKTKAVIDIVALGLDEDKLLMDTIHTTTERNPFSAGP